VKLQIWALNRIVRLLSIFAYCCSNPIDYFDNNENINGCHHSNLKLGSKCRIMTLISLANLRHPPSGLKISSPTLLVFLSNNFNFKVPSSRSVTPKNSSHFRV